MEEKQLFIWGFVLGMTLGFERRLICDFEANLGADFFGTFAFVLIKLSGLVINNFLIDVETIFFFRFLRFVFKISNDYQLFFGLFILNKKKFRDKSQITFGHVGRFFFLYFVNGFTRKRYGGITYQFF